MKRHGHGGDRGGAKKAKSVQFHAKPSVKYIEDDEEEETKESGSHGDDDDDDDQDHVAYESEDSDAEDGKKARPPPIQHKIQEGEEESTTRHDAYEDDDGVRMMPFNLKEDREDGHFDDSGNFVWAKGDKAVQEDAWLDGVSAQDMEIAEMARLQRQEAADDEAETWTERRAKSVFMEVLNEGETVLAALRRLGKKPKPKTAKQKKVVVTAQTPDMQREFNQLTDAADYMMRMGHTEIYHKPKEDIVDKPAPKPIVYWEYRAPDGQIQGPYPTATILAWRAQGYFQGDSAVQMRQCPATPAGPAPLAASAAQDLMDDFDDDDEEEEAKTSDDGWQSSDAILFRQFV
ncbi:hypothetical protein SPRG_01345 [Saprolegnia parasitica CBS 223.65]|uniref:GYF domain-containing protein n=1 Tax=Saprolegnia parasitica (strain CBS 223.65) TaxID=695850 RepID=A0A067D5U7_SAPPC|nr:hypothetical protein SPRG_01345 [Saprolegnia parasitica CBS 223.65]KDO34071.1 hypothetical protein SPRG_01345 [Saprolegnia parasitica CBS 223.65]|eukprot:XP_012194955.1 hypothetical protein SPRG_01345 [Saprolegnia parasitica CBS 223.65]